jgi:hypothetical protein
VNTDYRPRPGEVFDGAPVGGLLARIKRRFGARLH